MNHRFLDIRVVLPRNLASLEERIKKQVASQQERGRVEVVCSLQGKAVATTRLQPDLELARQYSDCLEQIRVTLGLDDPVDLEAVLTLKELITQVDEAPDLEAEWQCLRPALDEALVGCTHMREREGQALKKELLSRLDRFLDMVTQIEVQVPDILSRRQQELRLRVESLLQGMDIDPIRLAQETALMADKSDVTEEIVRLHSHGSQFRCFLEVEEPVGRRLDFLLQEFLREVNTVASKISNGDIAHLGVEMKNEIEKLREQVQNVE